MLIGWILWTIIAFLALGWSYGCRHALASGEPPQWGTAVLTLFWWVLAVTFLCLRVNKLHILWAAPVAFVASFLVSPPMNIPLISPLVLGAARIFMRVITLGVKKE